MYSSRRKSGVIFRRNIAIPYFEFPIPNSRRRRAGYWISFSIRSLSHCLIMLW